MLHDSVLTLNDIRVAFAISERINAEEAHTARPGVRRIATDADISKTAAAVSVARLIERGWILLVTSGGGRITNRYALNVAASRPAGREKKDRANRGVGGKFVPSNGSGGVPSDGIAGVPSSGTVVSRPAGTESLTVDKTLEGIRTATPSTLPAVKNFSYECLIEDLTKGSAGGKAHCLQEEREARNRLGKRHGWDWLYEREKDGTI